MNTVTQLIGIPLGLLMSVCYQVTHNYGVAIALFTLMTKVILFPVSMWVQRNSIKMVQLTPELNQLKLKYYGDKDTIAEETQALYKREKYHPLASTIPMFIQLILLVGVIGAVRGMLEGETGTMLVQIPAEVGGAALLMPVAAGRRGVAAGSGPKPSESPAKRAEESGTVDDQWFFHRHFTGAGCLCAVGCWYLLDFQ